MSRHPVDKRAISEGGRVKHFLRIARPARVVWHRSETGGGNRRVVEFCRIARGHLA